MGRGTDGAKKWGGAPRAALCLVQALALALAGCSAREAAPPEAVIAKVGAEKVTEAQFRGMAHALFKERAGDLLDLEENRGQRNEFLSRYIDSRRIAMLARDEGLDGDAQVKLLIEEAITQVYAQELLQRRLQDQEPTDEQLRAIYGELAAAQKAKGTSVPPFEEAKPYLPQIWKGKRQSDAERSLMEEIREKYPATLADGYKSMDGGY